MNDRANGASISTPCCGCSAPLVAPLRLVHKHRKGPLIGVDRE
jgi:hypothetical protein